MSRGDWTAARTHFGEAETVARAHGLMAYVPQLEYEYGVVALHEGNLVEAERRFRAMLASTSGVTDLDRYAARSRIAQIHVAQGDVARAERELIDATNAMDSLRAALNDRELRVLAFQAHKGYDETEVGFASIIAGLVAGGRVDGALALVERRRARELLDHLARSGNGLTRERVTGFVVPTVPDQRTAVLEFVTGLRGEPTTLFVLSSKGTSALSRPPADSIAADIQAFSAMIEAGARADTLARRLGDAVFGSALESLPADVSRLVIIGDGPLQHLPFDAVRLRDGRYLVDRFALSLAPSAAVVADLHGRPRRDRGAPRILAFGDPRFANEIAPNGGSAADVYRDAFSMNGGLPRLRASADEARLVARFGHQSELRLRERARAISSTPHSIRSRSSISRRMRWWTSARWRVRLSRSRPARATTVSSAPESSRRFGSTRDSWCCPRVAQPEASRCAGKACRDSRRRCWRRARVRCWRRNGESATPMRFSSSMISIARLRPGRQSPTQPAPRSSPRSAVEARQPLGQRSPSWVIRSSLFR